MRRRRLALSRLKRFIGHISFEIFHLTFGELGLPFWALVLGKGSKAKDRKPIPMTNEKSQMIYDQ